MVSVSLRFSCPSYSLQLMLKAIDYHSTKFKRKCKIFFLWEQRGQSGIRVESSASAPCKVFRQDEKTNRPDSKRGQCECCERDSREYLLQHRRGGKVRRADSPEVSGLHSTQLKVNGWSVFPQAYTLFKTPSSWLSKAFQTQEAQRGLLKQNLLVFSVAQPCAPHKKKKKKKKKKSSKLADPPTACCFTDVHLKPDPSLPLRILLRMLVNITHRTIWICRYKYINLCKATCTGDKNPAVTYGISRPSEVWNMFSCSRNWVFLYTFSILKNWVEKVTIVTPFAHP